MPTSSSVQLPGAFDLADVVNSRAGVVRVADTQSQEAPKGLSAQVLHVVRGIRSTNGVCIHRNTVAYCQKVGLEFDING